MSSIDIYPGYTFQVKHKNRAISKKLLLFVFLFIVGLAFMETVFIILISPNLKIDKVQVYVPASVPISSSDVKELAGITGEESFFSINPTEIENKLLECNLIKAAKVEKRFPSTVKIVLEGRTPFALAFIDVDGHTVPVTMDRDGVIFEMGEGVSNYGLPVISGLTFPDFHLGTRLPSVFVSYLLSMENVKKISEDLFARISEIRFVEKGEGIFDVIIYPEDGNISARTGVELSDVTLRKVFTALDVVSGLGKHTDEIDCRADKIVYRNKED